MKVREEIETAGGSADAATAYLRRGSGQTRLPLPEVPDELSHCGLVVAIDETPMGIFVELEGDQAAIAADTGRLVWVRRRLRAGIVPVAVRRASHRRAAGTAPT